MRPGDPYNQDAPNPDYRQGFFNHPPVKVPPRLILHVISIEMTIGYELGFGAAIFPDKHGRMYSIRDIGNELKETKFDPDEMRRRMDAAGAAYLSEVLGLEVKR